MSHSLRLSNTGEYRCAFTWSQKCQDPPAPPPPTQPCESSFRWKIASDHDSVCDFSGEVNEKRLCCGLAGDRGACDRKSWQFAFSSFGGFSISQGKGFYHALWLRVSQVIVERLRGAVQASETLEMTSGCGSADGEAVQANNSKFMGQVPSAFPILLFCSDRSCRASMRKICQSEGLFLRTLLFQSACFKMFFFLTLILLALQFWQLGTEALVSYKLHKPCKHCKLEACGYPGRNDMRSPPFFGPKAFFKEEAGF